jgi:hypothetical protein
MRTLEFVPALRAPTRAAPSSGGADRAPGWRTTARSATCISTAFNYIAKRKGCVHIRLRYPLWKERSGDHTIVLAWLLCSNERNSNHLKQCKRNHDRQSAWDTRRKDIQQTLHTSDIHSRRETRFEGERYLLHFVGRGNDRILVPTVW